nr:PASTA domain-containing protein [Haloechinothrix halophila]
MVTVMQPDESVPAGDAIGSDPPSGSELRDGESVQLFISMGACGDECPVKVPNVAGNTQATAVEKLEQAGFQVRTKERESFVEPGHVIGTDPKSDDRLKKGEIVRLFISNDPMTPLMYSGGTLAVRQTWTVDLDEGVEGGLGTDFWFQVDITKARYIAPFYDDDTTLTALGVVEPTYQACADAKLTSDPIDIADLQSGSVVCIRTDEDRLSVVTIDVPPGPSPGTMEISFSTFEQD